MRRGASESTPQARTLRGLMRAVQLRRHTGRRRLRSAVEASVPRPPLRCFPFSSAEGERSRFRRRHAACASDSANAEVIPPRRAGRRPRAPGATGRGSSADAMTMTERASPVKHSSRKVESGVGSLDPAERRSPFGRAKAAGKVVPRWGLRLCWCGGCARPTMSECSGARARTSGRGLLWTVAWYHARDNGRAIAVGHVSNVPGTRELCPTDRLPDSGYASGR